MKIANCGKHANVLVTTITKQSYINEEIHNTHGGDEKFV
jgi:hypothetical protein